MPQITDYATLGEVRELMPDIGTDAAFDALIPKIITRVSRIMDRKTKRSFGNSGAGTVRLFDGPEIDWTKRYDSLLGTESTALFPGDVAAITQIRVKAGGTNDPNWYVVPAGDYFLQPADRDEEAPAEWIELSDAPSGSISRWPTGFRVIEITGTFGWAAIPATIKSICLETTIRFYKSRGSGFSDAAVGVEGLGSDAIFTRAFSQSAWVTLGTYKRRLIA